MALVTVHAHPQKERKKLRMGLPEEVQDSAREKERRSEREIDESCDSDEEQYVKVAMTPEEAAAAKEAIRAMRRENKKAVRESQSESRKVKIKKKDKQRAINKTKGSKKK